MNRILIKIERISDTTVWYKRSVKTKLCARTHRRYPVWDSVAVGELDLLASTDRVVLNTHSGAPPYKLYMPGYRWTKKPHRGIFLHHPNIGAH